MLSSGAHVRTLGAPPHIPLDHLIPHPRLVVDDSQLQRAISYVGSDATAKKFYDHVVSKAPDAEASVNGNSFLTDVYAIGGLWRMTKDPSVGARCVAYLKGKREAQANGPLGWAESSHAWAIGFDWCQDAMDEDERAAQVAYLEKEVVDRLASYYKGSEKEFSGDGKSNCGWSDAAPWNQVCVDNGGPLMGVLALLNESTRSDFQEIIDHGADMIQRCLRSWAPDGVFAEGPQYSIYAMAYGVTAMLGFRTALNVDLGNGIVGLDKATDVFAYYSVPSGYSFNWCVAWRMRAVLLDLIATSHPGGAS